MAEFWSGFLLPLIIMVLEILAITVPLLVAVAFMTYAERKIMGAMQLRQGPAIVGPFGLMQPFADGLKLFAKEQILPEGANRVVFYVAPMLTFFLALIAWAVIPFDYGVVLSNINVGVLYLFAISSLGVYGIVMAGWASNSRYAFLGALRSAAQMVSYEVSMGLIIITVLLCVGSLNLTDIVNAQASHKGLFGWFWLPLLPVFVIYFVSGVAETNRAPFDVAEGESEIVAGFHVEYSGSAFAIFFLAEYANMILVSFLAAILFMGGWLSPFPDTWGFIGQGGFIWLFIKAFVFAFLFLWFRATFPRYRYDQIMRLGWKVFIPIAIVWVLVAGCMKYYGLVTIGTGV